MVVRNKKCKVALFLHRTFIKMQAIWDWVQSSWRLLECSQEEEEKEQFLAVFRIFLDTLTISPRPSACQRYLKVPAQSIHCNCNFSSRIFPQQQHGLADAISTMLEKIWQCHNRTMTHVLMLWACLSWTHCQASTPLPPPPPPHHLLCPATTLPPPLLPCPPCVGQSERDPLLVLLKT